MSTSTLSRVLHHCVLHHRVPTHQRLQLNRCIMLRTNIGSSFSAVDTLPFAALTSGDHLFASNYL